MALGLSSEPTGADNRGETSGLFRGPCRGGLAVSRAAVTPEDEPTPAGLRAMAKARPLSPRSSRCTATTLLPAAPRRAPPHPPPTPGMLSGSWKLRHCTAVCTSSRGPGPTQPSAATSTRPAVGHPPGRLWVIRFRSSPPTLQKSQRVSGAGWQSPWAGRRDGGDGALAPGILL